jgi:hypothetical protein
MSDQKSFFIENTMQDTIGRYSIVFACASNNEAVLRNNLLQSPVFSKSRSKLHIESGAKSASIAYNRALQSTSEELVVFLHQDVFLPKGWDDLLLARVNEVAELDPEWALVGSYGIGFDGSGYGPVWSTSLGQIVGMVPGEPVPVQSFDEMLMVVRRSSGLRFDEDLKGFHLYGTDIVQNAISNGLHSYAVPLPCIHNDKFKPTLDHEFRAAYQYLRRKWRSQLPVQTPILTLSWHGLNLIKSNIHNSRSKHARQQMSQSVDVDPKTYAARCGWSDVSLE